MRRAVAPSTSACGPGPSVVARASRTSSSSPDRRNAGSPIPRPAAVNPKRATSVGHKAPGSLVLGRLIEETPHTTFP
jgi:hypothetical protein